MRNYIGTQSDRQPERDDSIAALRSRIIMARKSKGFSELLRQGKRQSPEKGSGPLGGKKISEALRKFVAPYEDTAYEDTASGIEDYGDLIALGVTAWNASFLPEDKQQKLLEEMVQEVLLQPNIDIDRKLKEMQQLRGILEDLIARKKKDFSSYQLLIEDFVLEERGKNYELVVTSVPFEEKQ